MKHALLFVTILPLSIYSQTLKGVVLDSVSNEKLLYANLVIKNKSIGIYSNEDGTYKFDLSKASNEDTLVVSLIGFHNQKIRTISIYRF